MSAKAKAKPILMLVLRLLLGVAGIAYIAYSVDWYDHVVMPANTLNAGQQQLEARIIAGQITADGPAGDLSLQVPGLSTPVTLSASQLGSADDQPHYKPGVITMLRFADKRQLLLGLALVGLIFPLQSWRWWILLRARRLEVSFGRAFRLMLIGSFFNYCMPGTTGGDVIKAFYAARNSDRRADAVMTVVFDRIAGLLGLVLFGGIIGLTMLQHPVARMVTIYVWIGLGCFVLGASVYFSGRLRRSLGIPWLLSKLPGRGFIAAIDAAAVAYRHHLGVVLLVVLLSMVVHLILTLGTTAAGYALGMDRPLLLVLTVLPVLFLAGSIPLTYQGLGVMEGLAFALLLDPPAATANHLVGMLLLCRLYQMFYSLAGAVLLLGSDVHVKQVQGEGQGPPPPPQTDATDQAR
jgi:uncharacterized membrane protein YbhN (UPF0104 family)